MCKLFVLSAVALLISAPAFAETQEFPQDFEVEMSRLIDLSDYNLCILWDDPSPIWQVEGCLSGDGASQ